MLVIIISRHRKFLRMRIIIIMLYGFTTISFVLINLQTRSIFDFYTIRNRSS